MLRDRATGPQVSSFTSSSRRNVTVSLRLQLLIRYRIAKRPHALDSHFHPITRDNRADSRWRSARNQVSREERHCLGDVADDDFQVKDEIACIAVLLDVAVDLRLNADARPRINLVRNYWTDRTERVEALRPRPLTIGVLQISGRHIVHAGVSQDVWADIGIGRRLIAGLANHHAEFALEVDALGYLRASHRSSRR